MKKRLRTILISAAGIAVVLTVILIDNGAEAWSASARHSGEARGSQAPAWVMKLPLWQFLPVKEGRFAVLGEGVVRQTRWAAYAIRNKHDGNPCIDLVDVFYGGGQRAISVHTELGCARQKTLDGEAVVIKSGFTYQKRIKGPLLTADAFAIAVPRNASRVKVQLEPKPDRTFTTQMLSSERAKKAGVKPFGYAVFDLAHQACISGVTATAQDGETVAHADKQC